MNFVFYLTAVILSWVALQLTFKYNSNSFTIFLQRCYTKTIRLFSMVQYSIQQRLISEYTVRSKNSLP